MGQEPQVDRDAQVPPLPETCPYCKRVLAKKAFANGTTEMKCTQPRDDGQMLAHALTFYYKKK